MLHIKFCGIRSAGSGEEDFKGFLPYIAWQHFKSCDEHHVNKFSFLYRKTNIHNLVKNGPVVFEKSKFLIFICK